MNNSHEDLVGPRAHERSGKVIEDVDSKGVALYFAFLSDELTHTADEIQDAKNAFQRMKEDKPEVILMCAHKTVDECRELINPAEAA